MYQRIDIVLFFIATSTAGAATHIEQNPVLRELLEVGVAAGDRRQQLPPPTLPDGLTAEEQRQAIEQLGGARYSFDRLTRKSVVAPQIVRVSDLPPSEEAAPLRTVDFWFVVHVDLDEVSQQDFLSNLLGAERPQGAATALRPDQLQSRGIAIAEQHAQQENYGHLEYVLLDKVQIAATGRSFWSATDDSVVAAVQVDRHFLGDAEFPNHWSLVDGGADTTASTPYEGLGFYAKITAMHEPVDAVLVEFHLAFSEPVEWFRGTNQLGAKLPAVVQNQVREARRIMMSASRDRDR